MIALMPATGGCKGIAALREPVTVRTIITAIGRKRRPSPRDWYSVYRKLNVRGNAFLPLALMRQFSFSK
jgi:hypothetical protein